MANQENTFELALKAANENIAAIDHEHETLRQTLARLTADRLVLFNTQKALRVQLGQLTSEHCSLNKDNSPPAKNHLKGLGQAAAARKHLAEIGHSLTHAELVDALLKANFKTKSKHPSDGLRMAMQKRPDWFRWIKEPGERGRWELVEWPQNNTAPIEASTGARAALSLVR